MSARATRRPQPKRPGDAAEGAGIVQEVLAERRALLVANERLRLELEELRGRAGRPDPRAHALEMENRALREELAAARAELELVENAIADLLEEIEKASP